LTSTDKKLQDIIQAATAARGDIQGGLTHADAMGPQLAALSEAETAPALRRAPSRKRMKRVNRRALRRALRRAARRARLIKKNKVLKPPPAKRRISHPNLAHTAPQRSPRIPPAPCHLRRCGAHVWSACVRDAGEQEGVGRAEGDELSH